MTPDISIIIPAFNRKRLLLELLDSLAAQTLDRARFEILVMDNGSTDHTPEAAEDFARRTPGLQLRVVRMPSNRGPAVSRNHGASLARGSVLFFTDSDVAVGPSWLEMGIAPFDRDPELAMVSGPTVDKPDQPHSFFSVGTSNSYAENPIYPTSNVIYRKQVFDALGGFDPATAGGDWRGVPLECSDVDLAWKVIGGGYKTEFLPGLVVYHEVRREPLMRWLATQLRVMYIPMVVRRHPPIRKSLLWFGPFAAPENLFFYVATASIVLAAASGSRWWLIGLLPLVLRFLP